MTPTWRSDEEPVFERPGLLARGAMVLRGAGLIIVLAFGILATLIVRLIEVPLHRTTRPWTGWITVMVCRAALRLIGIRRTGDGAPMTLPGAIVANHSSWLDIFVLNAARPLYFVSKSEVADWPGIGFLARLTGTVFVRRRAGEAAAQKKMLHGRLENGHHLLFFPEGTSTDGRRVLPFKPTLFAALFEDGLHEACFVQPVSVVYHAPDGQDSRFYGWWGDMEFAPHLLHMLATLRHGSVHVTWHDPIRVSDNGDRKALSRVAEERVRSGHEEQLRASA